VWFSIPQWIIQPFESGFRVPYSPGRCLFLLCKKGLKAMKLSALLLPEFDQEMATTRKTLERVPEDRFSWKPHEKSMTMGRLAGHVADLAGWAAVTIDQDALDFQPAGQPPYQPTIPTSAKQLLDVFEKNRDTCHRAIAGASDEHLMKTWSLLRGGQTVFSMPRTAVLRSFCLNHLIHHRAQLSVYLRLNNIPVPSMYGPSADEGAM
jgi:uncharacterized damage-inducible protein DinB